MERTLYTDCYVQYCGGTGDRKYTIHIFSDNSSNNTPLNLQCIYYCINALLISIFQVHISPSGTVPGTAGLEAAEGADEPGAGGAKLEVALVDVAAAECREVH